MADGHPADAWNSVLGRLQEAPCRDLGGQRFRKAWWGKQQGSHRHWTPGPWGYWKGAPEVQAWGSQHLNWILVGGVDHQAAPRLGVPSQSRINSVFNWTAVGGGFHA